jgi:hypothetical protein
MRVEQTAPIDKTNTLNPPQVFSKSPSFAAAAAEGDAGCCGAAVAKVTKTLGVADRGGAGYWMQLKVRVVGLTFL